MIQYLFKNIRPTVSTPLVYLIVTVQTIINLLFFTVYGYLVLVVLLYLYVDVFVSVQPLSLTSLLVEISRLPSVYLAALISSLVTISGFVIAFRIAVSNWKDQMRASFQLNAASKFQEFFVQLFNNLNTMTFYIESLISISEDINAGDSATDLAWRIQHSLDESSEFLLARKEVSKSSADIHHLYGPYYTLFSTMIGMNESVKSITDALSEISKSMWIPVPIKYDDTPISSSEYLGRFDVDKCRKLLETFEENEDIITFCRSHVEGKLTESLLKNGLIMYFNLVKNYAGLKVVLSKCYRVFGGKNP